VRESIIALALATVVALGLHDAYRRGQAAERGAVLAQRVQILAETIHVRDSVYTADTIRLRSWRDRWDTVRVIDTVIVDNVVYVPRAVADSVVTACTQALRSCDARVAARDSVVRALGDALRAEQAAKPPAWRVWGERAVWALAGAGIAGVVR
jgi:hypothetical protein